jgi:predicted permease
VPIASATRVDLRAVLQEASTTVLGGARFRRSLVAVQLALSLMLLVGAGVLGRSLWNLRDVDLGLHGEGVYAFTLNPNLLGLRGAARAALRERVIDAFERTPGVTAVGLASPHAFMASRLLAEVRHDSRAEPGRRVETSVVSSGYFEAVGLALVAGRDFRPADAAVADDSSVRPGMITAALSRDLFGPVSALGRHVLVGSAFPPGGEWRASRTIEIVGVVADPRTAATLRDPEPARLLYEATGQALVSSRVYVRGAGSVASTRDLVRSVMREVAPGLPLVDPSTLGDEVDALLVEDRALSRLLFIVAGVATLLGFAGVYAVTAYSVSERTREFGVRIALGASGGAIVGQATRAVSVAAGIGAGLGLAGYALGARLIEARLFGVATLDPLTLASAVALLGAATLVAAWLPARRASRVDPVAALRAE